MAHQGYGFCEFLTEADAEYACKIMNQIKLWGKPIRVNKASSDKKQLDIGANLFIGNLDENLDERILYDTFSAFGVISTTAKIARDPQSGKSKGYGFISYNDFDFSDAAIEAMNGQYLNNKPITVQYAFKKDGKGERHGTSAERLLAAQARKNNALPIGARPPPAPISFGDRPPMSIPGVPVAPGLPYAPSGYQGQFAGVLAAPPPPPMGFTPQQTMMAPPPFMGAAPPGGGAMGGGAPPPGGGTMGGGIPPPGGAIGGGGPPPPPPGMYAAPPGSMPPNGMMGMPPPPPTGF